MKAIFRVENRFGCRDYDTLSEAKKNSTNDEYIKFSFGYGLFTCKTYLRK
jgi:hypothetical protein